MNRPITSPFQDQSSGNTSDRHLYRVSVREMAEAIARLIEQRFAGLAEIELPTDEESFILIAPERLGYLLKSIFKLIDGGAYLHIGCYRNQTDFVLEIVPSLPIDLTLHAQSAICSAARTTGFSATITDEKISLTAEIDNAHSRIKAVYETKKIDLGKIFERLFSEQ